MQRLLENPCQGEDIQTHSFQCLCVDRKNRVVRRVSFVWPTWPYCCFGVRLTACVRVFIPLLWTGTFLKQEKRKNKCVYKNIPVHGPKNRADKD